jgi:hypothetical protein
MHHRAEWRWTAVISAGIVLASGCEAGRRPQAAPQGPAQAAPRSIHFTDVTRESGLDMVLVSGRMPSTQILEVKGCGLTLIDFDADGDLDLFAPNGARLEDPEHGPGCRLLSTPHT